VQPVAIFEEEIGTFEEDKQCIAMSEEDHTTYHKTRRSYRY